MQGNAPVGMYISIHALREEGDRNFSKACRKEH